MQEAAEEMVVEDEDKLESCVQKNKQEDQREYVACLKCTHDCFYSPHSASSQLPPTAPSFLKVLDDTFSGWLEIPQAFVDASLTRCMGEAKLEGPSGWVWYTPFVHDTSNNLGKVAFGSPGWDDFAHDHILQRGDLLVFTYFSVRQLFKVQIFDAFDGTEKSQHCLPSKPHYASMSHCGVNQKTTSTMDLQVNDNKNTGGTSERSGDSTNHVLISRQLSLLQEPKRWTEGPNATVNKGHEIEESENQLDELGCKARSLKHNSDKLKRSAIDEHGKFLHYSKALIPFKQELEPLFDEKKSVPRGRYKIPRCNRKGIYNPYAIASAAEKERVEKEASAFHSKYPFLIKSLSASCIYKDRKLMWPKAFVNAHMPKTDTMMTWMDAEGKRWKCLWLPRRSYNKAVSIISAGWAPFVQAHQLIEHDVCIFELIKQDAMLFRVHIFKQRSL